MKQQTTIEFLNQYTGPGAADLKKAIALVNDQDGLLQRAAQSIAGEAYAGPHDVVAVFAQWIADELLGNAARECRRISLPDPAEVIAYC